MATTYHLRLTRAQHMALTDILGEAALEKKCYINFSENSAGVRTSAADLLGLVMAASAEVSGPAKPHDRDFLRDTADLIKARFPDGWGFLVLGFPFGDQGQLIYTSNARRADAIALLKEFLLKAGAAEDWMRHIK